MATGDPPPSHGADPAPLQRRLPDFAFVTLTLLALALCVVVARPFIAPLAWAVALAVVCAPLQRRLERALQWRGLAAPGTVALLAVLLIAATGLLIPRFIGEAVAGFTDLRTRIESGAWDAALQRHPWVASLWGWLQARIDLHDAFNRVAALLASAGSIAVRWSLTATVELVLTLFFLHYFLRDRERLLDGLRALLPTTADETNRLLAAARATVLATVYGKVLIGIVQGALGGLMFWWLDLPAPWFWAIVMGVLSIAPLVGAPLVWLPAALLLLAQGHWLQALILTAWGALVVGLADNVLYPIVVGRYLQLHTVLLVVAMIGGLFVFGSAGFFLGPVLLAVTAMMLQIWRERGRAGAG